MKTLKGRLGALSREAGVRHATPLGAPARLAERIERMRPARGRGPSAGHRDDASLAAHLNGSVLAPGVIGIEQTIPLRSQHGRIALSGLAGPMRHLPEFAGLQPREALFLDTETTGLSGGAGTVVFLLGLARVVDATLVIRQFLITRFAGERAMLAEAAVWVQGAETLVSYNGKAFDVPLLAARCRLARMRDPFSALGHLDLLHPTRRAYGARWHDCRLATSEERLLRFVREDDLPGAEAPDAWFRLVRGGDATRLPAVVQHNRWDLVSLSALLLALDHAHRQPLASNADVLAIARHHVRCKDEGRAYTLLREHQERLTEKGLLELARLHRLRGQWAEACAIWDQLAANGCLEAAERLAKYHEHMRADYETALAYAHRLPAGADSERRKQRLRDKLSSGRWRAVSQ